MLSVVEAQEDVRVLVVDYEQAAIDSICSLLARLECPEMRFNIVHAKSSEEAIFLMSQGNVDFALVALELLVDYACAREEGIGSTVILAYGAGTPGERLPPAPLAPSRHPH